MEVLSYREIIDKNLIENTLLSIAEVNSFDLFTCPLNQFKYCLQETGKKLFFDRNILKIEEGVLLNHFNYKPNMIDIYKLSELCNIYINLSHKYNKLIHLTYYGYMINMYSTELYNILNDNNSYNNDFIVLNSMYEAEKLTLTKSSIYKRLKEEREQNIKERCYESNSAVGYIALGNTEFGWNAGQQAQSITTNIISVSALPQLNSQQIEQKPNI